MRQIIALLVLALMGCDGTVSFTPTEAAAGADLVTWAKVWINDDGTASVVAEDSEKILYDGHQLPQCAISYTDTADYYTIGPCELHTPLTEHFVTVTLTVFDNVVHEQYYDTHEYTLIDAQSTFH